jgi:hypothetical protein
LPGNTDVQTGSAYAAENTEQQMLSRAFARFDPVALGIAVGVVSALGLWLMTAVLLLRGGKLVGLHLNRLSFFLIGYEVSWSGALIGVVEIGALGFCVGALIAWLWNAYHGMFVSIVVARQQRREIARELQGL